MNYYCQDSNVVDTALDGALFAKGLLLNAEIELSSLVQESGDPELVDKYNQLQNLAFQIETLSKRPIVERYCDIDSLRAVRTKLDFEIMSKSKAYGDYTANLSIKWTDVQKKLRQGDIAIEFVSYPIENDTIIYSAFVFDPLCAHPDHVVLFSGKQLDIFKTFATDDSKYRLCPELAEIVWGKLMPYLKDAKRVFFSPAGELYNIPIETILSPDNTSANFYRLSSTRQLAVRGDKPLGSKSAIYGGVQYNTDAATLTEDSKKYPERNRSFGTSLPIDSLHLRSDIRPLPGTRLEALALDSILHREKIEPRLLLGNEATEASFKALDSQRFNFLHVGTHGFYWDNTEALMMPNHLNFLSFDDDSRRQLVEDKALTRSGLLLAGASNTFNGVSLPDGVDDGVLTAKEISELDLRGLDLVVLSACQTGLGDVTGEGVFGLQRGFKKAGANTLLMSLWSVNDDATRLLMTRFYENLYSRKMSKFAALEEARQYLRDIPEYEMETNGEYTDEEVAEILDREDLDWTEKNEIIRAGKTVKTIVKNPFTSPRYWAVFILLDALEY